MTTTPATPACSICGKRVSLDPYGPGWVHTYPRWHIYAPDGHAAELGEQP